MGLSQVETCDPYQRRKNWWRGSNNIAAKLLVYVGEPEAYFSFITPEAYDTLKAYMDFRALGVNK
jgi:hypothetical protein